jgi:hypothetical protein
MCIQTVLAIIFFTIWAWERESSRDRRNAWCILVSQLFTRFHGGRIPQKLAPDKSLTPSNPMNRKNEKLRWAMY